MDEIIKNVLEQAPTVAALLYLVYRQQNALAKQEDRVYKLLKGVLTGEFGPNGEILPDDNETAL